MATKAKQSTKTKQPAMGEGLLGNVNTYSWHDTPQPPTNAGQGMGWIIVAAPNSQEEEDREYCAILYAPPLGNNAVLQDAEGDISFPFDGSTFLVELTGSGDHVFTATATYSDGTITRSLTVTVP